MNELKLITKFEEYREELDRIFNESVDYFMEVEGRPTLSAFCDVNKEIPELPKEYPVCCYAFICNGEAAGYAWIVEDTDRKLYYILSFIISEKFRRKKLGTRVIEALDDIYTSYDISELLVSTKNYSGLNFWVNVGYNEITAALPPEAQGTVATELNLRRYIKRNDKSEEVAE